jgi:hypothetical protein
MNAQRRDFLSLAMLAAAVAMPAFGQTVALADGPANRGAHGAAPSIPDFSGIWGHPYIPGFEPPASGPGPVTNRSRQRQGQRSVSDPRQFVGDYTNPILKPQAAEVVKRHGDISLAGLGFPTPSSQCWPEPVPYIFFNTGMQMLQQPDKITILYFRDHQVRHVRMNQPHPARVTPSWYGDSVARYEGDTLVIDTVGIKADRPHAMVDHFGTPYTEALHVVERYRLLDSEATKEGVARAERENWRLDNAEPDFMPDPEYKGKGLQLLFTVEDEGVFTTPWSGTITYRRPLVGELQEYVCAENRHEYYNAKDSDVPTADKPDF